MKFKTTFEVIYSKKTGKIIKEIWKLKYKRWWFMPWLEFPEHSTFSSYEDLIVWFNKNYPEKELIYSHYGREKAIGD